MAGVRNPLFSRVRDALLWHGSPQRFADRVAAEGAGRVQHLTDPEEAIAEGLARIVTCDPLPARLDRDVLLVGPRARPHGNCRETHSPRCHGAGGGRTRCC